MTQIRPTYTLEGLCLTCNHAASCALSRGDGALECDLFEDAGPVGMWSIIPASAVAAEAPQPRQGLCADCLNAEGCALSVDQAGVLSCADYR